VYNIISLEYEFVKISFLLFSIPEQHYNQIIYISFLHPVFSTGIQIMISLCNFISILALFGPNILLSTLSPNIYNTCLVEFALNTS